MLLCAGFDLCDHGQRPCQASVRLSEVRKLYVDSIGTDNGAAKMRERLIQRLRKSRDVEVVSDPKEAAARIKGTGRIWITGHTSLSPHSHSASQPSFAGFLSVEVVGRNGDTLWSYLVSPSSFPWNSISDDLARQLVSKFLAARKGETPLEPAPAGSVAEVEGTLRGADATFPAPFYQRWFELFQEQHPKVHISYDLVGSAEGIQRLEEGKIDFSASEMPVSDQAMADAHQRFAQGPARR